MYSSKNCQITQHERSKQTPHPPLYCTVKSLSNSDVDNEGAKPCVTGVGKFRPARTPGSASPLSRSGFRHGFFFTVYPLAPLFPHLTLAFPHHYYTPPSNSCTRPSFSPPLQIILQICCSANCLRRVRIFFFGRFEYFLWMRRIFLFGSIANSVLRIAIYSSWKFSHHILFRNVEYS
jgi:hypothetical protein